MEYTNPFTSILKEIDGLRADIGVLIERIPTEKKIKRYSPQDIADNTPLGIQTVWTAIKDGRIQAERFGRKYLIPADEFERVCKEAKSLKYKRT